MSPPPPPAPPNTLAEHTEEDALYYRQPIHQALEAGRNLLGKIVAQTDAPDPAAEPQPPTPVALPAAADSYDRVFRAMRRGIMLAQHLGDPRPQSPAQHRTTARKRIIREIEDAIE